MPSAKRAASKKRPSKKRPSAKKPTKKVSVKKKFAERPHRFTEPTIFMPKIATVGMEINDLQFMAKQRGIPFGGLSKPKLVRKINNYSF